MEQRPKTGLATTLTRCRLIVRNVLLYSSSHVIFPSEKASDVFFSGGELCRQRSAGRHRRRSPHPGEAPARIALRPSTPTLCYSSVHRRICVARARWSSLAHGGAQHGRGVHALCSGI